MEVGGARSGAGSFVTKRTRTWREGSEAPPESMAAAVSAGGEEEEAAAAAAAAGRGERGFGRVSNGEFIWLGF
jgi:hypothetical protein